MADPIGFVGSQGGVGPIRPSAPISGPDKQAAGPAFRDVLLENLREVNRLQQDATEAVEDLATGRRTDLEGVILATQKADTAFRALQAVRNRVMEAYEEIKQMRV